jgi:hypothetical protein
MAVGSDAALKPKPRRRIPVN